MTTTEQTTNKNATFILKLHTNDDWTPPDYAIVTIDQEFANQMLYYMDVLNQLLNTNKSIYSIQLLDYSPDYFDYFDDDNLILLIDENKTPIRLDKPINIPNDKYHRQDTTILTVCNDRIYWSGYIKHASYRIESDPIDKSELRRLAAEGQNDEHLQAT